MRLGAESTDTKSARGLAWFLMPNRKKKWQCQKKNQSEGVPERRMQVSVCGVGRGSDSDDGFVVVVVVVFVVVVVVVFVLFRCLDHPIVLPTKGFPFKWAPATPGPQPVRPSSFHVFKCRWSLWGTRNHAKQPQHERQSQWHECR